MRCVESRTALCTLGWLLHCMSATALHLARTLVASCLPSTLRSAALLVVRRGRGKLRWAAFGASPGRPPCLRGVGASGGTWRHPSRSTHRHLVSWRSHAMRCMLVRCMWLAACGVRLIRSPSWAGGLAPCGAHIAGDTLDLTRVGRTCLAPQECRSVGRAAVRSSSSLSGRGHFWEWKTQNLYAWMDVGGRVDGWM